ncbi:MAG: GTPase HflX [Clostridia bacterium]|nr:GTPase HflX [Clostridia bacterium]
MNLKDETEKIILAGVHTGCADFLSDTTDESIEELEELVKTAGGEVVGILIQNKAEIETGTYLGSGKLEELKNAVDTLEADVVVFDNELSPIQLKNITDYVGVKVLDRSMLILDIFAMRAKSGEGKLQVELAQLKYTLPRLRGMGTAMSRTGAGIGTRGPGETRLETDRRHISRRIHALEEDIAELKKHRELIRSRRKKDGVITAALVGYTNAGKSTLLNTLTDADVFAENKLFATLDPTSRAITLPDNRKILLVDTVGFIRKLPHHLVEAFKSTLEEAVVADVLLHVIDSSSESMSDQIAVTKDVLSSIGAMNKPIIGVYNKSDLCTDTAGLCHYERNVCISAKHKTGIDKLIDALADAAPGKKQEYTMLIPYNQGAVLNEVHSQQKVLSEAYTAEGTELRVLLDSESRSKLQDYIK